MIRDFVCSSQSLDSWLGDNPLVPNMYLNPHDATGPSCSVLKNSKLDLSASASGGSRISKTGAPIHRAPTYYFGPFSRKLHENEKKKKWDHQWMQQVHPTGRALTSDWFTNSFIMVVFEKVFVKSSEDFLSKPRLKRNSERQPLHPVETSVISS